jgi:phage tail sheath protein FI
MAFQISPGVSFSEVDLTTVVPAVSTTAGAFAGQFQWGPVEQRTLVTNEVDLVNQFGKPDGNTAASFFSAANFLAYGNNLQVVRCGAANNKNAVAGVNASATLATLANTAFANGTASINNIDVYDASFIPDSNVVSFVARYPGVLGNSLKVSAFDANTASANVANSNSAGIFTNWIYKSLFPSAPSTSSYVSSYGGANDQFHLVVIDEDGLFSNGAKGAVLEVFPYLSKASDAVSDDGTTAYYRTVIREQSKYIYAVGPINSDNTSSTWGQTASGTSFRGFYMESTTANVSLGFQSSFANGQYSNVTTGNITTAYDQFANPDVTDISLIITGDAGETSNTATGATANAITNTTTVQRYVIELAAARKDCVAFVSPTQKDLVGGSNPTAAIQTWNTALAKNSSYAFADSGWKYQFDKYNNVYRWIPLNGDMAGLCVRTDNTNDPWFSPAGANRGAIKNVVKLAWNPNQAQRDTIYSLGVNPVVSLPGQGTILYGDKTLVVQPTAFNRINVRRLFLVLEKAIVTASKYSLFEMNDEFTRAQFVALVEPFLRDVKGRRGIYDYRVVCDDTNNTPQVIDNNQFVGDIYVKPARSINYIQLNFIAARTGVNFNEIVGAV